VLVYGSRDIFTRRFCFHNAKQGEVNLKCRDDCIGGCDSDASWEERSLCRIKQGASLMTQNNTSSVQKKTDQKGTPEESDGGE
jgi:hypothetical protein